MVVFYNNYHSSNLALPELPSAGSGDQSVAGQLADLRHALAQAQAENRAHQARFTALMQGVGEAVLLTTPQGQALASNQCCRDLFGLTPDPRSHPQTLDVAAALQANFRDKTAFAAHLRARRQGGVGSNIEDFVLADGRVLECRYVVPADEALGHLLVFRDVTAQRRLAEAQQQQHEEREMFNALLDALKVEVAVFDAEHRYQYVNARCFKEAHMLEWIIGKDDFDLSEYKGRPGELARQRRERFAEAVRTRIELVWEETFTTSEGRQQLRRHFIPVFWPDGTLRMVVGTGSNVTRRRQAEEELAEQRAFYEFVLNHIPCDIAVFDTDGRYLFVNAHSVKDAEKREWMVGKDNIEYCQRYNQPLSRGEARNEHVQQAFREGRLIKFEEAFDVDGTTIHQLRCIQPVFNPDGSPRMMVGYGLDVTDRVNTERQLLHAKLAAESAVRARELFLANMSHEIRTPMNAILGMSQLLAKTPLAPDQDGYRQAITTSAEHLLVIINDILDLSKLEAGKMTLETVGFTPSHLLAEVEQTLHYQAVEKGLSLVARVASTVPPVLLGDPYRLRQVLLNLAGNAIKFTESGRVTVTCDLVSAGPAGRAAIEFRVADTGIGIEPEFVERLFQEFSQEDSSVTRKYGGTGLGLSISRNLLKLMGGELHAESVKGMGTVMRFVLPLPVGATTDLQVREVLSADSPQRRELRGKRVLLVEDNRFNRQIAKTFLHHAEMDVTEAEHGGIALDLAARFDFDLILMDIQMPVMDGYVATTLLRQQLGLNTPIVALTANAINGEREKCLAAGMSDYLTKPFKEEELLRKVSKWILRAAEGEPEAAGAESSATEPEAAVGVPPLYQTDELLLVGQGDLDFVKFMLETFVESCQEAVAGFTHAVREADVKLLRATAHTLRPSLVHLRALHILPPVEVLDKWPGAFEAGAVLPLVEAVTELLNEVCERINLDLAA